MIVVKIGGGLLPIPGALDATCAAVAALGRRKPTVVVPGGGPFADSVREVEHQVGLSGDAAHWMALIGMDQYAHLLAERIVGAVLVERPGPAAEETARGRIPVLAPSRWIRAADVLPHSWDASSDSIAAFIAGSLDAERLVVVKPAEVGEAGLDRCFVAVAPVNLEVSVMSWERFARTEL